MVTSILGNTSQYMMNMTDQVDSESSSNLEMIFSRPEYWSFLTNALNCELEVISSSVSQSPTHAIPLLSTAGNYGNVVNSLPFFGGHGIPVDDGDTGLRRLDLLREIETRIEDNKYQSVTLIENPLSPVTDGEMSDLQYLRPVDFRISQMTHRLPASRLDFRALMESFHPKTRNSIRKGLSNLGSIGESTDSEVLNFLVDEHTKSISTLGGLPKTENQLLQLLNLPGETTKIHWATTRAGELGAALMTLETDTVVEYFVPVVRQDLRDTQLLSALISEVMLQAFQRGCLAWNWGGTWASQQGVYRFKSRFNATDRHYRYFHWCSDDFLAADKSELIKSYPYWYSRKFD